MTPNTLSFRLLSKGKGVMATSDKEHDFQIPIPYRYKSQVHPVIKNKEDFES